MIDSFFPAASLTMREPESTVPLCGKCGLHKTCKSPKMEPTGKGRKRILIVAEAPGETEDEQGVQLVGKSGQFLRRMMADAGLDLRNDCWLDNALRCRPPDNVIKKPVVIDYCRPNVLNAIEELSPTVILLLGKSAARSVIGRYWKDDVGGIKRWAGMRIPCRKPNVWICPTFHPSFIMRAGKDAQLYEKVFTRHLAAAWALADSRPWGHVPDYESQVDLVYSPDEAASVIRRMIAKGGSVAFDYETDRLKPDHPDSRIVCASVCWEGKKTIAFPWDGDVIPAMKELLLSDVKKIGANIKFEQRWTRKILGCRVRGWCWDTMQQAHTLDSRAGITGLKFQAFVRLGQEDYDTHLSEWLKTRDKGGNTRNNIRNIPLDKLMKYCGLDSLLTFKVAQQQMQEMGVPGGFTDA